MATAQHTPGPWTLDKDLGDTDCWALDAPTHGAIAQIITSMADEEEADMRPQLEANAKLIAAAPDLLEACKMALEEFETLNDTYAGAYTSSQRQVEQAINKATK